MPSSEESKGCECECRSTRRWLAIVLDERELRAMPAALPGRDWRVVEEASAVLARVGADSAWPDAHSLAAFLRGVLGPDKSEEVRAAWVDGDRPLLSQLPALMKAAPLSELAPLDASPLLDVLDRGAVVTYFQPIVELTSGLLWGHECLMRGQRQDGSLVMPLELLRWARQEKLVFMLDRVSRESHLLNAGKANLPPDTKVLINFLPTAIYDPAFCLRSTVAAAAKAGLTPDRIIFEVVETEQISDRDHLANILAYYRASGYQVALDDVGAGYSGIMMLADLNPDLIKIDRALIARAPNSSAHLHMCHALVKLGHDNGRLVLAEGIETAEELEVMRRIGADLGQGWFFAKAAPEPVRDMTRFVPSLGSGAAAHAPGPAAAPGDAPGTMDAVATA